MEATRRPPSDDTSVLRWEDVKSGMELRLLSPSLSEVSESEVEDETEKERPEENEPPAELVDDEDDDAMGGG